MKEIKAGLELFYLLTLMEVPQATNLATQINSACKKLAFSSYRRQKITNNLF